MKMQVQPHVARDKRLKPWQREGRQPSRRELAGEHTQYEGPAYSEAGSPDWFDRACAARRKIDL